MPHQRPRGGTGTQQRSFRPAFSRTSDRTRRLRHCRQTIRDRTLPTRASAPKRATISRTSTWERCQQLRHSKVSEPRSTTRRRVHLSTSRSAKSMRGTGLSCHVPVLFASCPDPSTVSAPQLCPPASRTGIPAGGLRLSESLVCYAPVRRENAPLRFRRVRGGTASIVTVETVESLLHRQPDRRRLGRPSVLGEPVQTIDGCLIQGDGDPGRARLCRHRRQSVPSNDQPGRTRINPGRIRHHGRSGARVMTARWD